MHYMQRMCATWCRSSVFPSTSLAIVGCMLLMLSHTGCVQALTTASETPERLWTGAMATATAEELAHVTAQARAAQVGEAPLNTTDVG